MHIIGAGVRDVPRFNLRCRAQGTGSGNSREVHEGSVAITQPVSKTLTPKFAFTFASKPAQISLLFIAMSSRQESTSYVEKELGRCERTLSTASVSQPPQHSQTLLLCQQVPGTRIGKFTGKLKYTIHLKTAVGTDLASLLEDEAKRTCMNVLPSDSPFISIVFHYAYTIVDQTQKLVGVARIGDRSDIRVDTLLQRGSSRPDQLHQVPLLRPVKLSCQEFDCLELHVAENSRSGAILFSSSRALNRLFPFKHIHYNYDSLSLNPVDGGILAVEPDSRIPSVAVSVMYTPSVQEFNRFEGLEVAMCEISLPDAVRQCRDVVVGTQLVQRDSKMKRAPSIGSQAPFQSHLKKGLKTTSSIDHGYHVTVLQYQGKELTTMPKSYLLLPYFSKKSGGVILVFHVYGSSGTHLWWNTDHSTSVQLEISESKLTQLQTGQIAYFPWKMSSEDITQPCKVSGVMRWKSKQTKFFTNATLREVLDVSVLSPDTSSQTIDQQVSRPKLRNSTEPDHEMHSLQQDPSAKPFNPASIQQTLEGLVTPTQEMDATEAEHGVTNVLSQLTEFESNLQQMASDFQTLRKENQRLQGENEQLLLQMAKLKSLVTEKQCDLQHLSVPDLILKIGSLQQSLEAEERAHQRCRKRIEAMQNVLSNRQHLETQHIELQEAHTAQQKLIQLLRGKVAKYHKCSDICRKQEAIITQLESLLTKQAEGHPSAKDDAIVLLSKENAQLRALLQQYQASGEHGHQQAALLEKDQAIHLLKSQISRLVSHCQHLEQEKAHGTRSEEKREFDTRLFELEQKLLVADAKLSAQTNQLQENAKIWMSEKAHYELQLADFHSRLDTVIRSGQQVLSTTQVIAGDNPSAGQGSGAEAHQAGSTSGLQHYFSRKTNTKDFSL